MITKINLDYLINGKYRLRIKGSAKSIMIRNINRNRSSEMNGNRSSEMVVNIQSVL